MKINLERLNEITGGDKETNQELIDLFNQSFDNCLGKLNSAFSNGDDKSWKEVLHELKGASANMGITTIFELCLNAEKQANDDAEKAELLKKLTDLKNFS